LISAERTQSCLINLAKKQEPTSGNTNAIR
jgi:hypothetical protein